MTDDCVKPKTASKTLNGKGFISNVLNFLNSTTLFSHKKKCVYELLFAML